MKVEFSPYTFARVSVMKSNLLKKADYDKLLKMKIPEIIKYLEETEYKEEINKFGIEYSGADLVEIAVYKNLGKTLEKLHSISNKGLKTLILKYLNRKDIWNLKTIIRGKFVGLSNEEIKKVIVPVGSLSKDKLYDLIELDNISEILSRVSLIEFRLFEKGLEHFEQTRSLSLIENTIDQHYFGGLIKFLKTVPKNANLFKDFLLIEIDILNIKNLIKLTKAKMDSDYIKDHLFYCGKYINSIQLERMSKMNSVGEILACLSNSKYGGIISINKKEDNSLLDIELALDNFLLKKARFLPHTQGLSVNALLGYMFAKEIEIKNIHMLVRAKQLGVDEDYVKKHLVAG